MISAGSKRLNVRKKSKKSGASWLNRQVSCRGIEDVPQWHFELGFIAEVSTMQRCRL
jgi:hypothetical protein